MKQKANACQRTKKKWNIRLRVVPILVGTVGTVAKSLEKYWKNWKSKEKSRQFRS